MKIDEEGGLGDLRPPFGQRNLPVEIHAVLFLAQIEIRDDEPAVDQAGTDLERLPPAVVPPEPIGHQPERGFRIGRTVGVPAIGEPPLGQLAPDPAGNPDKRRHLVERDVGSPSRHVQHAPRSLKHQVAPERPAKARRGQRDRGTVGMEKIQRKIFEGDPRGQFHASDPKGAIFPGGAGAHRTEGF